MTRMLTAALLAYLLVGLIAAACSAPTLVQCRVDALAVLPLDDPDAITVGDARRLVQRLKACEPRGDAGQ